MLKFKSLGSGSTGNATVVEAGGPSPVRLLVDCGLGIRQLQSRLGEAGLAVSQINAIFITHEHGDHIGCALAVSRRHGIPVWMSQGTYAAIGSPDFGDLLQIARDGVAIDVGGLEITPFTVPHDASEPLQLSCTNGVAKLGIVTDLGHATAHVLAHLTRCDALLLECNHDTDMLARSAYPDFLKRRVGGAYGHLSNTAAADIARSVMHQGLKYVVAAHLSAQNNRTELVQEQMSEALGCSSHDIIIAEPVTGTAWLQI